jgi:glycine cleavage system aminomethyltransferase T
MGEGVLMRLAEEDFLFTSGPGVAWADYQFRKGSFDAAATQIGDRQFILQLQGPNALFVLEQATGESLRDIAFMRFRDTGIGGMRFKALRQGMAGEVGYELHGPIEQARDVFEALLRHGQDFGIRRLGGRTKMVNHVEACFPTPSVDYVPAIFGADEQEFATSYFGANARANYRRTDGSFAYADVAELYRTPVELGWRKNIKLDHDFIGRAALEPEVAAPKRLMVTLVWNADDCADVYASLFRDTPYLYMEMPRNILGCVFADAVLRDGATVGVSTSRCYSYHFRKMLSLCVLDAPLCVPGTEVGVVWGRPGMAQKTIRATVAPAPYKKDNRRLDVSTLVPTVNG